jgi:hypothetical protein
MWVAVSNSRSAISLEADNPGAGFPTSYCLLCSIRGVSHFRFAAGVRIFGSFPGKLSR